MPVRYIHPERRDIHLLDKVISFDDAQEAVYRLPPPLIVVGSAGSGKTALTLEKLKHTEGEVLYVTHSAYLAHSARDLYYGHGFEHGGQDANFLSYREFVESLRVPAGRAVEWRDFAAWFARQQQAFKGIDAHQAFEEIRGVITADAAGPLTRSQYLALGVRQSISPKRTASGSTTYTNDIVPGSARPALRPQPRRPRMAAATPHRATTSWSSTKCRTSPWCSWRWCWRR